MTRQRVRRALRGVATTSALVILAVAIAYAWGRNGHKIINRTAVRHLPASMSSFAADSAFYETHASDADGRKIYSDTSFTAEFLRHYIDIDDYTDFRHIPHDRDSLVAVFGWERVKQTGTNPWITVWLIDTLTEQLRRGNLAAAKLTMADLGHYVGDAHQPLHATANYDGQLTGNNGIHGLYESTMINKHLAEIIVVPHAARYIDSPLEFAFAYLYESNSHVDSIMIADTQAKIVSGGSTSDPRYDSTLWHMTRSFTKKAFQAASEDLASIWYTAWVNAGLSSDVREALAALPAAIRLHQNYPNPFNPETRFLLDVRQRTTATLKVYDVLGRPVATLLDGELLPGTQELTWDAAAQAGGIYYYVLQGSGGRETGKMLLMR